MTTIGRVTMDKYVRVSQNFIFRVTPWCVDAANGASARRLAEEGFVSGRWALTANQGAVVLVNTPPPRSPPSPPPAPPPSPPPPSPPPAPPPSPPPPFPPPSSPPPPLAPPPEFPFFILWITSATLASAATAATARALHKRGFFKKPVKVIPKIIEPPPPPAPPPPPPPPPPPYPVPSVPSPVAQPSFAFQSPANPGRPPVERPHAPPPPVPAAPPPPLAPPLPPPVPPAPLPQPKLPSSVPTVQPLAAPPWGPPAVSVAPPASVTPRPVANAPCLPQFQSGGHHPSPRARAPPPPKYAEPLPPVQYGQPQRAEVLGRLEVLPPVKPKTPTTELAKAAQDVLEMYGKPITPIALPPVAPPAEKALRRPPRRMVGPPTRMPQAYPTPLGILRAPTAGSGWQSLSDAMLDLGLSQPRPPTADGGTSAAERMFGRSGTATASRGGTAAATASTSAAAGAAPEDAPAHFRLISTPRLPPASVRPATVRQPAHIIPPPVWNPAKVAGIQTGGGRGHTSRVPHLPSANPKPTSQSLPHPQTARPAEPSEPSDPSSRAPPIRQPGQAWM